jgi:hypothetical protein
MQCCIAFTSIQVRWVGTRPLLLNVHGQLAFSPSLICYLFVAYFSSLLVCLSASRYPVEEFMALFAPAHKASRPLGKIGSPASW